jgi:phosphonate transport system substrate-binding protein
MMNRRHLLLASAGAAALAATPAMAQADWRQRFPELVFAIVPAENAATVNERFGPLMAYMSRELGVRVTLRIANDYAAVIEGQRVGNIHIGAHGPASFARALMVGAQLTAVVMDVNADGSTGYHAVFYVRADSPFQRIEDLRGRALGLVDPNSTSGNNVPLFELNKMGIDPERFFGRVVNTGSHQNAIIALQQGTVDVATNWWNNERESNLTRMASRGMARAEDFRVIHRSAQIVNSPTAVVNALGPDAIRLIQQALIELPRKAPDVFLAVAGNPPTLAGFAPVTNEAYNTVIELNRFVDNLRRRTN